MNNDSLVGMLLVSSPRSITHRFGMEANEPRVGVSGVDRLAVNFEQLENCSVASTESYGFAEVKVVSPNV